LLAELLNQWPVYLAFVTSFATVLIMWVHHHSISGPIAAGVYAGLFFLIDNTAGAIGLWRDGGTWLLLVANWDSERPPI
jgi:hypothetical protein